MENFSSRRKRVTRGSSSSSGSKSLTFVDLDDVVEIPPPSNSQKRSFGHLKGEKKDVSEDLVVIDTDEEAGPSYKGKEVIYISDSPIKNPGKRKKREIAGSSQVSSQSSPITGFEIQEDPILMNLQSFKKFDMITDFSDHHYKSKCSSVNEAPKNWAKKVQDEWRILEKDLPDEIFVRVYESRMDLLRAVIVGAEGTPYHHGLFFFDVFFPSRYPKDPPHVHYHSGGLRLNPNLYACGKVCLSLLNTWHGNGNEMWVPGVSSMLQVLVSIQALILNAEPFFNEPGYVSMHGTKLGQTESEKYNEDTLTKSLQTMLYSMRRPPKHFEYLVVGHFYKQSHDILLSCKAYIDGAHVGSLVKGGIQDVDESPKSCSKEFKEAVAKYVNPLVQEFTKLGAKDCEKFCIAGLSENEPVQAVLSDTPLFDATFPFPLSIISPKPKIAKKKHSPQTKKPKPVKNRRGKCYNVA